MELGSASAGTRSQGPIHRHVPNAKDRIRCAMGPRNAASVRTEAAPEDDTGIWI